MLLLKYLKFYIFKLFIIILFISNLFVTLKIKKRIECGIPPLSNFSKFDYLMPETHRLVGSLKTDPHEWPWTCQLVAVKSENKLKNTTIIVHKCGCALIDKEFIVTAAHCFAKSRLSNRYKVLLGGHAIYSGLPHNVVTISIHPLYQIVHSAYDVALLKISPKAIFNESIWPICLPTTPPKNNVMCVVTGWGRLKEGGERSLTLREIHVPIISTITCNDFRHYSGRMHPTSMICAGFNNGQIDACQGDSGGPLQCQNTKGVWELQGLVSWGIGCAQPKFPGVYAKIFVMKTWIGTEMNKLRLKEKKLRNNKILLKK
ncbi:Serine proteinase [Meloidogyne graminicola]|uniref:Serine proteinase n=1 Tax=Meloidogyne graminicola TaxID=189291 RepID=A0A8T0A0B6_9BILA|nr:Serine proteinase [Meloidogyne graminicola]